MAIPLHMGRIHSECPALVERKNADSTRTKYLVFAFFLLVSCTLLQAQKNINLIVLASGGEKFNLIVDGVKFNLKPEASVKVNGVKSGTLQAQIVFEDTTIKEIKDKIYTVWEGKETSNKEFTYVIEKKGSAYRMRFLNMNELMNTPPSDTIKKDSLVKSECKTPMGAKEFDAATQAIGGRSIEDSRLSLAKNFLERFCLSTQQIAEVCAYFEYDDTRLNFIKAAYEKCTNKKDYKSLSESLEYKNTKKEFEEFMTGKQ